MNEIMRKNIERLSPEPKQGLPFHAQKVYDHFGGRCNSKCYRDSKNGMTILKDPVAAQVEFNRVVERGIHNLKRNGETCSKQNASAFSYMKKGSGNYSSFLIKSEKSRNEKIKNALTTMYNPRDSTVLDNNLANNDELLNSYFANKNELLK